MKKINIRGVVFDNVTKEEALQLIISRLEKGEITTVFTPNSEIVQSCIENKDIHDKISAGDVILPDGAGIIKASKILGTPLKEKVAGVEIGEALFEKLSGTDHSFFLFGGKPGEGGEKSVAEDAALKMAQKYSCIFAGTRHGYYEKSGRENDDTAEAINSSGADVLYVCLGSPAQERWAVENLPRLKNIKLVLCLGGSLDIYAGRSKRAPSIFIKAGLEWLWRLICHPERLVRMMKLPKFYIGTLIYKKKSQKKTAPKV